MLILMSDIVKIDREITQQIAYYRRNLPTPMVMVGIIWSIPWYVYSLGYSN